MSNHPIRPMSVVVAACMAVDVSAGEVIGPSRRRSRRAVVARMIFVGMMREVSGRSYPELAREINGNFKGHSTAHGLDRRWKRWNDTYEIAPGLTKAAARQAVLTHLGLKGNAR